MRMSSHVVGGEWHELWECSWARIPFLPPGPTNQPTQMWHRAGCRSLSRSIYCIITADCRYQCSWDISALQCRWRWQWMHCPAASAVRSCALLREVWLCTEVQMSVDRVCTVVQFEASLCLSSSVQLREVCRIQIAVTRVLSMLWSKDVPAGCACAPK